MKPKGSPQPGKIYDRTGRDIRVGDVLKVFHFEGGRRKKHFMYKHVVGETATPSGVPLFEVDHLSSVPRPPYYLMKDGRVHPDFEIVQGIETAQDGNILCFEDRPRVTT